MPIYRQHRLVHIHVPKTGGTAIEKYFHEIGDMEWGRPSWLGREQHNDRWYELQHLTWTEFVELSAGQAFEKYDSFSVVRDPYARLLSDFLWRKQIVEARPWSTIRTFDSFRDFLWAIPADVDSGWPEHVVGADRDEANFFIHVRPQHHYVCDPLGNCQVDDLLRFECLDRELAGVLDRYGLRAAKIRQPAKRDLSAFYDRELYDRVNDLYAKDFDQLGYERI